MEKIGIEEVHHRVLDIAKEFDRICTLHNIPYYMLGGTMLGAIRHKGFIPWDDDMDFGVPIEHYDELFDILEKELSYPYRCCRYDNNPAVLYVFFKIEDVRTVIDEKTVELPLSEKLGINIDIFPLNKCHSDGLRRRSIRIKNKVLKLLFLNPSSGNQPRMILQKTLHLFFGEKTKRFLQNRINKQIHKKGSGQYVGNLLGRWAKLEIIPKNWYGNGTRYAFEDTTFIGIEKYHEYLTRLYGDYMTPPKKAGRLVHAENVFIK